MFPQKLLTLPLTGEVEGGALALRSPGVWTEARLRRLRKSTLPHSMFDFQSASDWKSNIPNL